MGKRRPSGDGMVRKRDDGRWEGRIVVGHKANGDPIFRHVYAKTQKALTEKLHQSIECYQDVELTEDSRMTLGEWLDRWLAEYKDGTIRPGTLEGYRNYIENYIKPQLGGKQVSLITTQDVQRMYRRLKSGGRVREDAEGSKRLSDSTVRHIHTMLHGAMRSARSCGATSTRRPGRSESPGRCTARDRASTPSVTRKQARATARSSCRRALRRCCGRGRKVLSANGFSRSRPARSCR